MFTLRFSASRQSPLVLLLVIGLLLIPTTPARAATEACPSSISSYGFKDLGGLSAETVEAINCIAHYGVAKGVSSTKFAPGNDVSRWQMALFLVRTAADLGIALPTGNYQGFSDILGLDAATQKAINQLSQLGITKGTGPSTFDPHGVVPRWQMALFLTRLLTRAGVVLPGGSSQGFNDIGGLALETQIAINQLAQLGVAKGTTNNTYSPHAVVARWQMALFLARSLETGGATPYVMLIALSSPAASTADQVTVTVYLRDLTNTAVSGRRVDLFVGTLDSAGRCALDSNAKIGSGDAGTSTNCTIDGNDPRTDAFGAVTVSITHSATLETDSIFAWVGESGEVFDNDLVRTKTSATVQWTQAPTALVVDDVTARYGTQATIVSRFTGGGGLEVPLAGQRVVFTVKRAGSTILVQTVFTGIDGRASFGYVGPADPSGGNDPTLTDNVTAFWDKDGDGVKDSGELSATSTVTWDDDLPRSDAATLSQSKVSTLVGESTQVTIKVTDKFGNGIAGAKVSFDVSGANTDGAVRTTNGAGIVSFDYTATAEGADTIDASVDFDGDGIEPEDLSFGEVVDLTHYQVEVSGNLTDGPHNFDLIWADTGSNTIDVVDLGSSSYLRLRYDSQNDTFSVNGDAKSLSQFEGSLGSLALPKLDGPGGTALQTNTYTTTTSGASTFTLTTG